jgi:nucleoid-associated protein YgaU
MAAITISAPAVRTRPARPAAARPAPRVPAAPVRLTRRGRRLLRTVVVSFALLVTLLVASVTALPALQAGTEAAVPATTTVVVQPGQTMWELARDAVPGADPRETIQRIASLNSLSGADASIVYPGQELVIPLAG